eukprot:g5321.t1
MFYMILSCWNVVYENSSRCLPLPGYVLSQQGDWIFQGLLLGEFLEYAVTMCTIFRLFAASEPDDRKLMPPPCRPLQFHRLEHGVESVKEFGQSSFTGASVPR